MLDLPLSPDQLLLQGSLQRFLADTARPGWGDLSETLGLGGIAVPEAAGGFGGGMLDIASVMAELGPALAGANWLSHTVATWLLGQLAPSHAALAGLAKGTVRAAIVCPASTADMPMVEGSGVVRGSASLVAGGAEADLFLLADPDAILLIVADPAKVEQRHRIMLDCSVTADLGFALQADDAELLASGPAARLFAAAANDMMLAARCAEATGLIGRMVADSADYLTQRRQFGTPIGSFQALRHRAADMQLAMMKAVALTEAAIGGVHHGRGDRAALVSAACVEVRDAVRIVGESAVQIHGAMGLTEELCLGGHFKRALAIAAALGPEAGHLARFAQIAS